MNQVPGSKMEMDDWQSSEVSKSDTGVKHDPFKKRYRHKPYNYL